MEAHKLHQLLLKVSLFDFHPMPAQPIINDIIIHGKSYILNGGTILDAFSENYYIIIKGKTQLDQEGQFTIFHELEWVNAQGKLKSITECVLFILSRVVYVETVSKHTLNYINKVLTHSFPVISRNQLQSVSNHVQLVRYRYGQTIYSRFAEAFCVYYLLDGEVTILLDHQRTQQSHPCRRAVSAVKQLNLLKIQPGSFFGEDEPLHHITRQYLAQCSSGTAALLEMPFQLYMGLRMNESRGGHFDVKPIRQKSRLIKNQLQQAVKLQTQGIDYPVSKQIVTLQTYADIEKKLSRNMKIARTRKLNREKVTQDNPIIPTSVKGLRASLKTTFSKPSIQMMSFEQNFEHLKSILSQEPQLSRNKTSSKMGPRTRQLSNKTSLLNQTTVNQSHKYLDTSQDQYSFQSEYELKRPIYLVNMYPD